MMMINMNKTTKTMKSPKISQKSNHSPNHKLKRPQIMHSIKIPFLLIPNSNKNPTREVSGI